MGKAYRQMGEAGIASGAEEMSAAPLMNTTRQLQRGRED